MALEEYRRKRKFEETPEPGPVERPVGGNSFVVQMHSARRLHYDFRLEMDGVLKSWAVPKGPSLNPKDKRLAVMTEDHPLDYGSFEGVIPKGNYGAGPVMVWDYGTYQPEGNAPPSEQVRRGEIKFRLEGKKLRGSFVLVKLKGSREGSKGNEWLLIKHRDGYSDESWDIERDQTSALTGRTLDEINEGKPIHSAFAGELQGTRRAAMPRRVEPMLATLVEKPFSHPAWLFELKWDGMRAVARIDDGKWELWSRSGRDAMAQFPELAVLPERLSAKQAIVDGEIVVLDDQGRADFERMQSRMHTANPPNALLESAPIVYYLFDVLYCDGFDLRGVPLIERKQFLRRLFDWRPPLRYSDHVREQGRELYELASQRGVEGIVGKRLESPYVSARSQDWVKLKVTREVDAVIGGFTAPRGSQRFGALLIGLYSDGRLQFIGGVGTGFDQKTQEQVWSRLHEIESARSPFAEPPKTKERATWVQPELVARVKYVEWTDEARLRAPVFLGLRADIDPRECRVDTEKPVATPPTTPATKPRAVSTSPVLTTWEQLAAELDHGHAANAVVEIEGKPFRLSNLNKVYYPREGYTKRHLLAYYYHVAPVILPFLRDRPMVLRRNPDGITGESFFQKDVREDAPEWMPTFEARSERKTTRHFLCNDLQSLLFLTNLGCIEHNPWASRIDDTEHPDYLFFDLDPAEGTEFPVVVKVAAEIHKVLERIKLKAFLKISGATGFHMWVPIERVYTFDHIRTFTEIVARLVAARMSDEVTLERTVGKREAGKVYIDFSQNAHTRPLTAPYSARPFPAAPVSAPVVAKELKSTLSPAQFTIQTMPGRLKETGDLWKDFWISRQHLEPAIDRLKKELP